MTAAHVDRHHDGLGELLDGTLHELGVGRRRRAQDRPRGAGLEQRGDVLHGAQPSAHLHGNLHGAADRLDHLAVVPLVERGVEVDDVQPAGAFLLEAHGHLDGILGVGGLGVGVALQQPDGVAAAQVDRGDHDHAATACTKRSYTASPASPDFSGWNCVANTLSFATAAANVRPYVVAPTVVAASTSGANECTK